MSWALKKKYDDLIVHERGYIKKVWGKSLTVCLVYPNIYRIGMSNLGFQTIYALINSQKSFLCERAFLPDPEDETAFTFGALPLFSLESQKPLSEFDIVAFSISFENDYPNVLKILDMAKISLRSSLRKETEPLVIGGGVSISLNPEPVADFFDLFLIGEGEEVLTEFLQMFEISRAGGLSREETLFCVQKGIAGAYVPKYYEVSYADDHLIKNIRPVHASLPAKVKKRWVKDINGFTTEQCIVTPLSEFKELFLTEVSRGCQRGCRFCAVGFLYRPARFRNLNTLKQSFRRGIDSEKKIGLLGTAVSDHPGLLSLCRYITEHKGKVSFGSLRLDQIGPDVAVFLSESGIETVSLAPEAGTERLINMLHKGISEDDIFTTVELLSTHGISNIRLYFMVGLPSETEEDVDAIISLVKRIHHHAVKCSAGKKRLRRITLSINQFIPKPSTPFQWCPLEDINVVKKRIKRVKNNLRGDRSVKVIHDLPKWNYIQALLSLGDRRVSSILLAAHKHNGNWSKAFKDVNVNPDFYVYRRKGPEEILPWDFIEHGIGKELLARELKLSEASCGESSIHRE